MNKKNVAIGIGALILASTAVTGLWNWISARKHIHELESEITVLQRKEKHSAVLQSVSSQLEEIAYQQKEISDEQREEALQQTRVANEMRERSELERQNAIIAQNSALASERKALDAFDLAENQRQIAEHQRLQAEFSKRVADTLSYIALGRSLGSLSITRYNAGNREIADMLSYAAYLYTNRYGGDVYNPAVYQSLTLASQSQKKWTDHSGAVTRISFVPKSDTQLVSISSYGEILFHEINDDHLKTTVVLKNKAYDFRDVYIAPKTNAIYALSRSGHLFIQNAKNKHIIPLDDMKHPMKMENFKDGQHLLIIGENSVKVLDMNTYRIIKHQKLDYQVSLATRSKNMPLLFDTKGKMHYFETIDKSYSRKVPVSGHVTAFASSNTSGLEAYGMSEGSIYLLDKQGKMRHLIGHRSRISKVKLNNNRLYSSSYDGSINLWIANSEKIDPMPLTRGNGWIMHFTFDQSKDYLWFGNQTGELSEMLMSVPRIIERVRNKIKRDFTQAEWNYYVGPNIPFESFIDKDTSNARKEDKK